MDQSDWSGEEASQCAGMGEIWSQYIIDVGREGRLAGFPTSKIILFLWGIYKMK